MDAIVERLASCETVRCGALWGSAKALALLALSRRLSRPLLVIAGTTHEAEDIYADLLVMSEEEAPVKSGAVQSGKSGAAQSGTGARTSGAQDAALSAQIFLFPHTEILLYEEISPYADIVHQRIRVLHTLLRHEARIVVVPLRAWLARLIPQESFLGMSLLLQKSDRHELGELALYLVNLGYTQVRRVERSGEFTVKGGILDVFPSNLDDPCRIEFFDLEIESLRRFDAATQRSLAHIDSVLILPEREILLHEQHRSRALDGLYALFPPSPERDALGEILLEGTNFPGIENYLPLFFEKTARIDDFFSEAPIRIAVEGDEILRQAANFARDTAELYNGYYSPMKIKLAPDHLYAADCSMDDFDLRLETLATNEPHAVMMPFSAPLTFLGDLIALSKEVERRKEIGQDVFIFAGYDGQADRIASLMADCSPIRVGKEDAKTGAAKTRKKAREKHGELYIGSALLANGFVSDELAVALILEREIFNRKRALRASLRKVNSLPIDSFLDLKPGDPVVHIQHGIGLFAAIERMNSLGLEKDYLKLEYRDGEKLYVPLEMINQVQRYIGHDGESLKLDSLGGRSWERTKERVRKNAEELARELLEVYAARMQLEGFSFGEDSRWQHEFESAFEFEETPDQALAIEETRHDMQGPRPMDRLVCGDVGFGKTEVAMRAAFRAALAGRQTAVLVPTTILAEQHHITFSERFALFPAVHIEYLNRFRSPVEQKEIMRRLAAGHIDIIIGTHRLLSDDVRFKNLGLVVVDEEQRFGVRHKERLKKMRRLVDVLTLSATPIPRTLHMSLINVRDMSVIRTPPRSRLPVETYVLEFNENMIKRAIMFELDRGGQVYYLHFWVQSIERVRQFLQELIPQAAIGVAHGQLPETQLEKVMHDFIEGHIQILLCTSIIESGLDIPNANTLIIDHAEKFGLGQLYQIRGRVGRSSQRAFAYLFYPPDRALTEDAQRRLQVITEYTELGSGYDLAMRDLEIRGVGNLFGPEQSGDVLAVGFDMYCRILDEAMQELGSAIIEEEPDTAINLNFEGYIPDDYIEDERQKIEVYKRIAACLSQAEVEELAHDVRDRFGPIPEMVLSLFKLSELKAAGRAAGVRSLIQQGEYIAVEFVKNHHIDPAKVVYIVQKKGARLVPQDRLLLLVKDPGGELAVKVDFLKKTLQDLKEKK
ncbi:MAG: transcription-repair coupling factor [Spirochaetota bacterium]|nr:transcription-repair coupling factor [Spirochaetota bacterium]